MTLHFVVTPKVPLMSYWSKETQAKSRTLPLRCQKIHETCLSQRVQSGVKFIWIYFHDKKKIMWGCVIIQIAVESSNLQIIKSNGYCDPWQRLSTQVKGTPYK